MTRAGTATDASTSATDEFGLAQLVERNATCRPDDVAIESVETGRHSWLEVHETARRWASGLVALGVRPGDLVVTMLPTGLDAVVGWVAAAAAGGVDVPLNHAYRGRWLSNILDHLGARVAVIDERFWPQWEAVVGDSSIEHVVVTSTEVAPAAPAWGRNQVLTIDELASVAPPLARAHQPRLDDIACIVHTSGTTGQSKGVMLSWDAWRFRAAQPVLPPWIVTRPVRYFTPTGSFHVGARRPWYVGALEGLTVVTRDGFSTDTWLDDIRDHDVTVAALLGAMASFILRSPPRPDDADNPLQAVLMAPMLPDIDAFQRRFGLDVLASYAMTEIPHAFVTRRPHVVTNATRTSCGLHEPSVAIRIVGEDGRDVAAGDIGELWVGGEPDTVNSGYYRQPEATAEAWRDGWFHTGDLFRFDDAGRHYFVDRKKDAIRRRGENISSAEVEEVIAAHPDVAECAAIGVPSEFGEEEVKVVVVPVAGRTIDPGALIEACAPNMATFAVPRYVEVVDALPRTPTTKVRKAELRDAGVTDRTWDRLAGAEPRRR